MTPLNLPVDLIHQLSLDKSLDVFISYRRINGSSLTSCRNSSTWEKVHSEKGPFGRFPENDIWLWENVLIEGNKLHSMRFDRWLKKSLEDCGFSVVIDEDIIDLEGTFVDNLLLSVTRAKNLILVLSENALDRCMNDEDCQDWVHYEIMMAMHSNCNIIPIMDNFQWPQLDQLPKDMLFINNLNAIRWARDCCGKQTSFDELVERIRNQNLED